MIEWVALCIRRKFVFPGVLGSRQAPASLPKVISTHSHVTKMCLHYTYTRKQKEQCRVFSQNLDSDLDQILDMLVVRDLVGTEFHARR